MREKILTYIEKNSRVELKELAILLGLTEVDVANELEAMEKEGMNWTQLRNPEGFGGMVMGEYGINGIPACLILDKNGNFYKTNMRGAFLDAFLYDYYKR